MAPDTCRRFQSFPSQVLIPLGLFRKIPNSKHQAPNNIQKPTSKSETWFYVWVIRKLEFIWDLLLGI
jgi:hypothetical protein